MAAQALLDSLLRQADYFVLLLFRVGGLVVSSPLFGRVGVPAQAKTGLVLSLTLLFFTLLPQPAPIVYSSLFGYGLILFREVLIGIALAFVTNLFFSLTFVAGQLIDMQIGFGIVNVYDQQNNTQIPMVGNLYNLTLLIVFFAAGGHRRLFAILYTTLQRLPVGSLSAAPQIGLVALELFSKSFLLGVQVALPIIASGLILELCFGVLIRTVPQMNMFVVGIPAKIVIGFVILWACVPVFVHFGEQLFDQMFLGVEQMFATFAGVP
ncbi:MAG: flagellar biosynthetic protein FliR [Clostridiales bacterium]|nr:flagellar biosynthetic protein FliR [Clostridiales bacterium]